MEVVNCPACGSSARPATLHDLELYRCANRRCGTEFIVQHSRCQYPGCQEWGETSAGMPDYCWFHANMRGITPEHWGEQHPCAGYLCSEMLDTGEEYCAYHKEEQRNAWD